MAFLDNFKRAFQDIVLYKKQYSTNKYWEKVENGLITENIQWVLQERKAPAIVNFDKNKSVSSIEKEFELRVSADIEINKNDEIEANWNKYKVVYVEKVIVNWNHDHNLAIVKYIE